MKESKSEKRMREFSIANFLMVTGLSFLAFTGAMKLLDGVTIYILLKIGLVSLGLGAIALFLKFLVNKWDAKQSSVDS